MSWALPPDDQPGYREELIALRDCLLGLWRYWPVYLAILAVVLMLMGFGGWCA